MQKHLTKSRKNLTNRANKKVRICVVFLRTVIKNGRNDFSFLPFFVGRGLALTDYKVLGYPKNLELCDTNSLLVKVQDI